ncbi:hypothetical protein C6502_06155 [Candidatus Poribacteria bacterium]|nr:MAG: hypothetical protein C6502_06155 [Candidatus Poribacteria bacterium]
MKIVNRLPLSKLAKGFIATYIRVTVLVVPLAAIAFVSIAVLFEHFTMTHAGWGIIMSAFMWLALIGLIVLLMLLLPLAGKLSQWIAGNDDEFDDTE